MSVGLFASVRYMLAVCVPGAFSYHVGQVCIAPLFHLQLLHSLKCWRGRAVQHNRTQLCQTRASGRWQFLAAVAIGLLIFSASVRSGQITKCSDPKQTTVMDCASHVQSLLRTNEYRADVKKALQLVSEWNARYEKAYLALKIQGRSKSAIEKLQEEVLGEVNPLEIAKDKGIEDLVKRYLSKLATLMGFIRSTPVTALAKFLEPSEIATDFDELLKTNELIQKEMWAILRPVLQDNWEVRYRDGLSKVPAGPQIKTP